MKKVKIMALERESKNLLRSRGKFLCALNRGYLRKSPTVGEPKSKIRTFVWESLIDEQV